MPSSPPGRGAQRASKALNQCLRILLYSANLWYLGEGLFGPLFGVYVQRIGGSVLDVSWAWGLYLLLTGALMIAIGRWATNERAQMQMLLAGYVLNALCTFGYLLVRSPWQLFVVQAGLGVALALSGPTWSALYTEHLKSESASFVWGLAAGQQKILTGIAIVCGGLIVHYFSFTALFVTMGVIQVLAALYQAQFHRDTFLTPIISRWDLPWLTPINR